ncbi:hypothetical protein [Streptomyces sp. SID14515]|uniref:hypothetical protein n=1 Tax=Streptomyces sp. SID14515 TaxID=2706074 RepID=UPI0013CA4822|nr:hypothetical protein [Streptomyces sp. SID14515]NEB35898.1 hypothetical protein [Streptomyces sp. SID14515]
MSTEYAYSCADAPGDTLYVSAEPDGGLRFRITDGGANAFVFLNGQDTARLARDVAELAGGCQALAPAEPAEVPQRETLDDALAANPTPPVGYTYPPAQGADANTTESEGSSDPVTVPPPVTFGDAMLPQPGTVDRERAYIRARELLSQGESQYGQRAVVELARFLSGEDDDRET